MWFGEQPAPVQPTAQQAPPANNNAYAAQTMPPAATNAQGVVPAQATAGGIAGPNMYPGQPANAPVSGYGQQQPPTSSVPPTNSGYQSNSQGMGMGAMTGGGAPMGGGPAPVMGMGGPPPMETPHVDPNTGMAWIASLNKYYYPASNQYYENGQWIPATTPPPGFPQAGAGPAQMTTAPTTGGAYGNDWSAQQNNAQPNYGTPGAPAYDQSMYNSGYGSNPAAYGGGAPAGYQGTGQPAGGGYSYGPSGQYPSATTTATPPVGYDAGYYAGGAPNPYAQTTNPPFGAQGYGQPGANPAGGYNPTTGQPYNAQPVPTNQPQYGTGYGAADPNAGGNAWSNSQPPTAQLAPPVQPVMPVQPMHQQTSAGSAAPTTAAPGYCKVCKVKEVWKEAGRAHQYCGKGCARKDGNNV